MKAIDFLSNLEIPKWVPTEGDTLEEILQKSDSEFHANCEKYFSQNIFPSDEYKHNKAREIQILFLECPHRVGLVKMLIKQKILESKPCIILDYPEGQMPDIDNVQKTLQSGMGFMHAGTDEKSGLIKLKFLDANEVLK